MISLLLIPSSSRACAIPARMPSAATLKGRPRSVWVGVQPPEVGDRQILEVCFRLQHARALVVDVQEVLQVGEGIGRADRLDAVEGQGDAVALRQLEHQLGFEAALDVQMQFGLGQAADEGRQIGAHEPYHTARRAAGQASPAAGWVSAEMQSKHGRGRRAIPTGNVGRPTLIEYLALFYSVNRTLDCRHGKYYRTV